MKLSKDTIEDFQEKILQWYVKNKRDLPWRKTRDPYRILVSEVMLQQTQVGRVIPKYEAWLKEFPTVNALAKTQARSVLKVWSGLGYNRRALYLKKTAQEIVSSYKGKWPRNTAELEKLPGIGVYTAGAVACFAFNQQIAVVDTNIRKVILTQFAKGTMETRVIQEIANQLLPKGRAYEWNQALMDYSAAVLKKEKIPIPKQSKFIGSNRYYRGKLLRLLLEHKRIPKDKVGKLLKENYADSDAPWLELLLTQMEKDGLIKNGKFEIRL